MPIPVLNILSSVKLALTHRAFEVIAFDGEEDLIVSEEEEPDWLVVQVVVVVKFARGGSIKTQLYFWVIKNRTVPKTHRVQFHARCCAKNPFLGLIFYFHILTVVS